MFSSCWINSKFPLYFKVALILCLKSDLVCPVFLKRTLYELLPRHLPWLLLSCLYLFCPLKVWVFSKNLRRYSLTFRECFRYRFTMFLLVIRHSYISIVVFLFGLFVIFRPCHLPRLLGCGLALLGDLLRRWLSNRRWSRFGCRLCHFRWSLLDACGYLGGCSYIISNKQRHYNGLDFVAYLDGQR